MDITGLGSVFDFGTKVLERIFPDPKDRLEAQAKLMELQQTGELAVLAASTDIAKGQMEINKIEAAHPSLFIAGWRSAAGWCGVFGLAYHAIIQPLLLFIAAANNKPITLPVFDNTILGMVLTGMLGLGTMRSFEKYHEVDTKVVLPWLKRGVDK